jgi:hypothetical protein
MESWNTSIKPDLDFTHAWSATPLYFIINDIVGYRQINNQIVFEPRLGSLQFVEGTLKTIYGNIKYHFYKKGNSIIYKLNKNFNNNIVFNFPSNKNAKYIYINDKLIDYDHKNIVIKSNNIEIKIIKRKK